MASVPRPGAGWAPAARAALILASGAVLGAALAGLRLAAYASHRGRVAAPLAAAATAQGVVFAAAALLLWALAWRLLARRLPAPRDRALAAAALPWAALGLAVGWLVNRHLLPAFWEPSSLAVNAVLALAMVAAWPVAARLLARFEAGLAAGRWGRARIAAVALAAGIAALQFAGRWPVPAPARGGLVGLHIHLLRADRLGCYGYPRATSPRIDGFAADSVLFEQAVAQSTFTKTSVASLFTGLYPHHHGVYIATDLDGAGPVGGPAATADVLSAALPTLAERLSASGLLTAGWVQNPQLQASMGFAQGFDLYRDQPGAAPRIRREFATWQRRVGRRGPFFAYLHLLDLHDPYRPPPPWDRRFGHSSDRFEAMDAASWRAYRRGVRTGEVVPTQAEIRQLVALYDGQLAWVDREVGAMFDDLKASGLYEPSVVVVTGDHGDAFMEHGFISHSHTPYEELVRVPLIVKLPGSAQAGRRVREPVALLDLAPTLLELAGADGAAGGDGQSLGSYLSAEGRRPPGPGDPQPAERAVFSEHRDTLAVRRGRWKYIRHPSGAVELYELSQDPGERHDLSQARLEVLHELEPVVAQALASRGRLAREKALLDPETLRELEALGYLEP